MTNQSCKHDPDLLNNGSPIEEPLDSLGSMPCNPDSVYFDNTILPIINSSCAIAGCHDAITHQDGIDLTTYNNILKVIKPLRPDNSDLFDAITEDDVDKIMPRPPFPRLTTPQIAAIEKWILQGAKNNKCNEEDQECNTEQVSYKNYIKPAIDVACKGCHTGGAYSGGGIPFDTYVQIKNMAGSGKLLGAISHENGYSFMPKNTSKWSDCRISKFKSWIENGSQNN